MDNEGQEKAQSSARKAREVAGRAKEFGRDLTDKATDLAGSAADALQRQGNDIADQTRELASNAAEKLQAAVASQKSAGADYLGAVGNSMRRASHEFDAQLPQAGNYIRGAAEQIDSVAEALRTRDMSQMVADMQDFARRQPVAFLGAAVLAGFAAVRFFKSAPDHSAPRLTSPPRPASASSSSGMQS